MRYAGILKNAETRDPYAAQRSQLQFFPLFRIITFFLLALLFFQILFIFQVIRQQIIQFLILKRTEFTFFLQPEQPAAFLLREQVIGFSTRSASAAAGSAPAENQPAGRFSHYAGAAAVLLLWPQS